MKESKYNIFCQLNTEKSIVFNALTKRYILVSSKYLESYEYILKNFKELLDQKELQSLLEQYRACGLLIDDDIDEWNCIRSFYNKQVREKKYSLLIMSTYACNFKCWYCIQHHQNISLTTDIENRIRKHIKKYLLRNNIKEFDLSWFGGEPLMNFSSIESISEYAMLFCNRHNIHFSSSITSNGSLLNADIIQKMVKLNFVDYQITIDGSRKYHNKVKFNSDIHNSFATILDNIKLLAELNPKADITLRINYTHKNITENLPNEIDEILKPVRDRIHILFRQVWQESEKFPLEQNIIPILFKFKALGYHIVEDFGNFSLLSCYVEKQHYLSIYPNGFVDNCNNKAVSSARGYLNEQGDVVWNQEPKERDKNIFTVASDCKDCKYLPICMGPCPESRERITDRIICHFADPKTYFEKEIKQYVLSTLH